MSMTKAELKNAFREAASYEFREIPRDDSLIQHEFSPEFERKIAKLIQKEKEFFWHFVNTASKRVAVIAAVLVMLLTTACSVEAIREPIVRFLIEVYETFTEYTFEGEKSETITKEYQMSTVPEGFTQTDYFKEDAVIITTYENSDGDMIRFSQSITTDTNLFIDNESSVTKIIDVSGREVHLYIQDGLTSAIWLEDTYLFKVFCHGDFSEQSVIDIIETIK